MPIGNLSDIIATCLISRGPGQERLQRPKETTPYHFTCSAPDVEWLQGVSVDICWAFAPRREMGAFVWPALVIWQNYVVKITWTSSDESGDDVSGVGTMEVRKWTKSLAD